MLWIEDSGDGLADAMFTHDPSLMSDHGAIILRMGKPGRMAEPELHKAAYQSAGIPILGEIVAPGSVEGGDCVWVDTTTLAIGRGRAHQPGGYRTGGCDARAARRHGAWLRSAARQTAPTPACT